MPDARLILLPVFLAAQAMLVNWAGNTERPPSPPTLSRFPSEFDEWKQLREDTVDSEIADILGADQLLSRSYVRKPAGSVAGLFVAWYQSQRRGASQPHSPKVCLPGSGWTPEATGDVMLDTAAGTIAINRYVVVNGQQRAVVLYWYQSPRRVVTGEWAAKFWVVADALCDHRTDTALVRVTVWSGKGLDDAATAVATGFARNLYPLLREYLPR